MAVDDVDYSLDIVWHSPDQRKCFGVGLDAGDVPYIKNKYRYHVFPCGRRWGKTTGAIKRLVLGALESKKKILWVDTTQLNVDRYCNEILLPILPRPEPGKKGLYKWDKQKKILTIPNNGTICFFGSSQKPENLEGFGYDEIYINEAGIILKGDKGERLWRNTIAPMTMEGNNGAGAVVFFIGTPKGKGLFKEFAEKGNDPKFPDWITHQRSSYANPLLREKEIDEIVKDLPPQTVQQEIFGLFMDDDEGMPVVRYEDGLNSLEREPFRDHKYIIVWGVDVAYTGNDESALARRQGAMLLEPVQTWQGLENFQFAEVIKDEYMACDKVNQPDVIYVDDIGYGAGAYEKMRELGLPVKRCNSASKSKNPAMWPQKRDELWFAASAWVKTGSLNTDRELFRELTKPILDIVRYETKGSFKVESKDNMRKRLKADGKSPNRADAFIFTFAAGVELRKNTGGYQPVNGKSASGSWMSS